MANDPNRTLSWFYGGGSSLQVPAGWTGRSYLVSDQSFTWSLNGHTYAVYVTSEPNVTPERIAAAAQALGGFTAGG